VTGAASCHPEVSKDARAKSRAARSAFLVALVVLFACAPATASYSDALKEIPSQTPDALERLHFLEGAWHCTQYSSSNDPKFGAPYQVDLSYTFLPGANWLREDTTLPSSETLSRSPLWNHALYIGHNDEYNRRPGWSSQPFEVYVAGDDDGVPGAGQSYAGWVGKDFKIFDEFGGVTTLKQTGAESIEWQYQPRPNPDLVFYPNRLRKCTR
jgi:hypothetical protein